MSQAQTQGAGRNPLQLPLEGNCRAVAAAVARIWFEVVERFTFVVKLLCK